MSSFILGLHPEVADSAMLTTSEVYEKVGHNTGNLAFHYAIDKLLGGNRPVVSWYAPPEQINATGTVGVLPCANQLGSHANYGSLAERFKKLTCSLVAVGLGAQGPASYEGLPEVPQGTIDWVRQIVERAPSGSANIGVRGEFTRRVLEEHGLGDSAVVLGCPSLFINPDPQLGRKIEARLTAGGPRRIAVAAGHQAWRHLSRIESSLCRLMAETGGVYITQSPLEMVMLGRGDFASIASSEQAAVRNIVGSDLSPEVFETWANQYARVFFSVSAWMEYLRRYDFVIGSRIHGIMLGLQAGLPSLCIAHDSRTRELCETMCVPFVMASDIAGGATRSDILRLYEFDGSAFDSNRATLASKFSSFFDVGDISLARTLDSCGDTHAV